MFPLFRAIILKLKDTAEAPMEKKPWQLPLCIASYYSRPISRRLCSSMVTCLNIGRRNHDGLYALKASILVSGALDN